MYEHADYAGASGFLTEHIGDLKGFVGPCAYNPTGEPSGTVHRWDDCISSIRVAPGWQAILFRDDDFTGDQLRVTADTPDLRQSQGDCDKGGFNDCTTSIRVNRVTP